MLHILNLYNDVCQLYLSKTRSGEIKAIWIRCCCCSVIVSNSLWPHGLQNSRFLCLLLSPGIHSNSCLLSWWCYLNISSSTAPFSFSLQFFSSIGIFSNESALHVRWPTYYSFSFSVSTFNEYSRLISFRLTGWSPCCPRDFQEFSPAP